MRVLFSCLPGYGHFNPLVPVARAVTRAGHQVAFATAGEFCPRVTQTGFEVFPTGLGMRQQIAQAQRAYPTDAAMPPGEARFETFVPRMLAGVAAPARAADLVPLVRWWRPDVVVHDEAELAAPLAALGVGVPWASHSIVLRRPPSMALLSGRIIAPLAARYRVELGPSAGLYRYLHLDACPPSLQDPAIPPVAVSHPVRNTEDLDTAAGEHLPSWVPDLPAWPTVYVTLGMLFNRPEVLAALLRGFWDERINVIATVGAENLTALKPQPANVHIEAYTPLSLLLPYLDLVVTQGGTSILPALSRGLPLLVVPQGADQFHNAAACVSAGAALRLLPGQVQPSAVRSCVRRLLDESGFARAAQALRQEITALPRPDVVVGLLERLAAERQPIPGPSASSTCAAR